MAVKIFLDSNATDLLVYTMRSTADALYDHAVIVYARLARAHWEGASKDDTLFQLQLCTSALKRLADQLDLLGFQLSQEVEQWLVTASKFGG